MKATIFSISQDAAWRVAGWMAAGTAAAVLTGCVVPPVEARGGYYESTTVVYDRYGSPPPARVEYRTVAPAPDYVWVGGAWEWSGSRYNWRPGRWDAPRVGYVAPARRDDRPSHPPAMDPRHAPPPDRGRVDDRRRNPPNAEQRRPGRQPEFSRGRELQKEEIIRRQRDMQWGTE